jgi:hypothetical protein
MARIAIMALEGLEEVVDAPVDAPMEDTSVEEIAEQPENEIIEMNSISDEMEDHSDSMEEAADTAETLTDIHDQMGESLETGGLDETAAAAIEVAVEHMLARVGFPPKRAGFALEAFKSKASRVHATKVAMEGIAERAKQVWAAIVASFKKVYEWIKNFIAQVLDGALKMEKRAEDVIKAAQAKKGKTPTADVKIKGSNLVKYLRNDNKIVQGSELIAQYEKHAKSNISNTADEISINITSNVICLFDDIANQSAFDDYIETIFDFNHKRHESLGGVSPKEVDGMTVTEEAFGLSDFAIHSTITRKGAKVDEIKGNLSKSKVSIDKRSTYKEIDSGSEFIALTPDEVIELATAVQSHMKIFNSTKDKIAKLEAASDNISKKANAMITKDLKDEKQIANVNLVKVYSMKAINTLTTLVSKTRSVDINITKAALDYCASSLKKTGEGDAPAQIENKKTEEK